MITRVFSPPFMKRISASLDFRSQCDQSVLFEASVQNELILFGHWTFHIRFGNQTLSPAGEWSVICEHKEKGCDYFEIDIPLSNDYRLQRCFLVDHKDQVLLLCDTVLADESVPATKKVLSYQAEFNVSPKLRAKISEDATEIEFRPVGRTAVPPFRALPLALPEWKAAKPTGLVGGSLDVSDGTLKLRQETTGKSLFVPVFFDLNADRLSKRYTWRQLSVGENLERMPEDKAVGYRIQLNSEQFLLYRSLTSKGNRTVLGHNLIDDFCFARFDPETGVEPLIAVEVVE